METKRKTMKKISFILAAILIAACGPQNPENPENDKIDIPEATRDWGEFSGLWAYLNEGEKVGNFYPVTSIYAFLDAAPQQIKVAGLYYDAINQILLTQNTLPKGTDRRFEEEDGVLYVDDFPVSVDESIMHIGPLKLHRVKEVNALEAKVRWITSFNPLELEQEVDKDIQAEGTLELHAHVSPAFLAEKVKWVIGDTDLLQETDKQADGGSGEVSLTLKAGSRRGTINVTAKLDGGPSAVAHVIIRPGPVVTLPGGTKIRMIYVQGGTFQMGSNESARTKPIHKVTLSSYWFSEFPITKAAYGEVMKTFDSEDASRIFKPEEIAPFLEKLNVISKEQTGLEFDWCTEAQWEFASRGGTKSKGYTYAGSDRYKDVQWHGSKNSTLYWNEQDELVPNELGIYAMCYPHICKDLYLPYPSTAQTDPCVTSQPASAASESYYGKHVMRCDEGSAWPADWTNYARRAQGSSSTYSALRVVWNHPSEQIY